MSRGSIATRGVRAALLAVAVLFALPGMAPAAGVTNSGDDGRTGWYPDEASLTPQLVSGGTFGRLWTADVDGQVYAQPLLAGNALVVATEGNHVYGLDPATGAVNWDDGFGTPFHVQAELSCGDLAPDIGITSTPVVDMTTRTIYTVVKSYVTGSSGAVQYQMHALDLDTGAERSGFPATLSGSAQNAPGQAFNARTQLQRPGLLLMNGVVYAAFGSHCDVSPFQGWVFGVSTAGAVRARWVSVAAGNGAGIWQSGSGLASDGPGRIEFGTGNDGAPPMPTPGTSPPDHLGESVVRLQVQSDGTLKAADFFAPNDAAVLDTWDADFASGGLVDLPDAYFGTSALPHLAVAVGKEGWVYLLNRDHLGGIGMGPSGSDDVVQRLGPNGGVWSRPGVWPGDGGWLYIPTASGGTSGTGSTGFLRVYSYGLSAGGTPTLSLQATSADAFGFGSSAPVITSDGARSGSALVWTVWTSSGTGQGAQLRAYDPVPVDGRPVLRWSAPIGTSSKFAMPGVGAGRIYVGTRDGHVLGFGSPVSQPLTGQSLNFPSTTVGQTSTRTMTLTATRTVTISDLASDNGAFTIDKSGAGLPKTLSAGQTLSFSVTFSPTQASLYGGTLTVTTDQGKTQFGLTGNGQATGPQLAVTPPLVSFGGTSVGGHLGATVTFRNVGAGLLTINAVHLPGAPFSSPDAPRAGDTIAPGASINVTVDFDPTQAGSYSDQIGLDTDGGDLSAGLTGSAGTPGRLVIRPEEAAFGRVAVGASATRSFTITNTGETPVTVTRSKPPVGGDFAATTQLPEGTTIVGGETLTESVRFKPTASSFRDGTWSMNGNDTSGLHSVHFTGGPLPPASTLAVSRVVSAPAGTQQASAAPLLSGKCPSSFSLDRFKPGQTTRPALVNAYAGRSCTVTEDSPNEDGWTTTVSVNGGAAQSARTATFTLKTGANTVVIHDTWRAPTLPAMTGSGWQRNGDASVASGLLQLNTSNNFSAGSAFWPTVVDPRNATIEFDSTIPQSASGADGMTLVFADATQASPTSVGSPGGRLGFGGIAGVAVALDTYQNTQDPYRYLVGVTDGPSTTAADSLHWLATAHVGSSKLLGTHHVKVTTASGTLTVSIDGSQVLSTAATLPARALIGFSGATGGVAEQHEVGNATATGLRYLARPALAIATRVVAPAGSNQAAGRADYVGRCTSEFEAGDQGNGDVARPGLSGAPAGQPCDVGVFVPPGAQWTVKAAVGSGSAQSVPVRNSYAVLPEATLNSAGASLTVTLIWTGAATYPPAPATPTPPVTTPAHAGPVAAWGFDERGGRLVRDATGHGHAGVIHGALRAAGRYGAGLSFDGIDDWVTVPDAPSLRLRRALTLEAWVRPTGRGRKWRTVVVKQRGAAIAYGLYAAARHGRPAADVAAGGDRALPAPGLLRRNAWTFIAVTYDGRRMRLYVEARLVASRAVRGPLSTGRGPLRFGGNGVWSEFFKGRLDELRLYDRALTAAELRADRGRPVVAGTPAHPVQPAGAVSGAGRSRAAKPMRRVHRTV